MAASEFFFAIDVSGTPATDMLADVVAHVLEQAGGSAADGLAATVADVRAAVDEGLAVYQHGCRLAFVAVNGHLEISLSSPTGRIWQAKHALR